MTDRIERRMTRALGAHIFTVSAQLVGICLTVLGLFQVMTRLQTVGRFADGLLAVDAIAFLGACVFSYASLRSHTLEHQRRLERAADVCFGVALVLMTAVCVLIAWRLE